MTPSIETAVRYTVSGCTDSGCSCAYSIIPESTGDYVLHSDVLKLAESWSTERKELEARFQAAEYSGFQATLAKQRLQVEVDQLTDELARVKAERGEWRKIADDLAEVVFYRSGMHGKRAYENWRDMKTKQQAALASGEEKGGK